MLAGPPEAPYAWTMRVCKKTACPREAVASCGFDYSTRKAWIAPLHPDPHPSSYDLCDGHASALTPPRGWSLDDLREPATVTSQAPLLP